MTIMNLKVKNILCIYSLKVFFIIKKDIFYKNIDKTSDEVLFNHKSVYKKQGGFSHGENNGYGTT